MAGIYTNINPAAIGPFLDWASTITATFPVTNGDNDWILADNSVINLTTQGKKNIDSGQLIDYVNNALSVRINNGGSGNLTGGHTSNYLDVLVTYIPLNINV